jgi:hypothetical protein
MQAVNYSIREVIEAVEKSFQSIDFELLPRRRTVA